MHNNGQMQAFISVLDGCHRKKPIKSAPDGRDLQDVSQVLCFRRSSYRLESRVVMYQIIIGEKIYLFSPSSAPLVQVQKYSHRS